MTDAKRKRPSDPNRLAAAVVAEATGETEPEEESEAPEKNPAAVALGRLGGLKGGRARADKLSPRRRVQIAIKAARARWADEKKSG